MVATVTWLEHCQTLLDALLDRVVVADLEMQKWNLNAGRVPPIATVEPLRPTQVPGSSEKLSTGTVRKYELQAITQALGAEVKELAI